MLAKWEYKMLSHLLLTLFHLKVLLGENNPSSKNGTRNSCVTEAVSSFPSKVKELRVPALEQWNLICGNWPRFTSGGNKEVKSFLGLF